MKIVPVVLLLMSGLVYGQDSLRSENQKKIEDLKKRISLLEGDDDSEAATNYSQEAYQSLQDSISYLKKELKLCSQLPSSPELQKKTSTNKTVSAQNNSETKSASFSSEELVFFEHNIYQLNAQQKRQIDQWIERNHSKINFIMIVGHADNTGSLSANEKISRQRAEAIQAYLISKHQIDQDKLLLNWFANQRPQELNGANNRRCSIALM
jgi:outer membrane protein OmpA-like peptidoglycan-associated protein